MDSKKLAVGFWSSGNSGEAARLSTSSISESLLSTSEASESEKNKIIQAKLPRVGIFFGTQFPSLGILLIKKLEIEITYTTQYTTFKTDIIKVVLVFSISNFFTSKNSQGRKLSAV